MAKQNELATPERMEAASAMPDFLAGTAGVGNECVTSKDVTYPRIGVIQALSPELDKDNAKYINGASLGDLFNTLTREIIPQPLRLMDTYFQKTFGVFRLRTEGGGFKAQFNNEREAVEFVAMDSDSSKLEIVDTGIHVCLLLDADLRPAGEAVMFYTKSKLKVSRQINTLLRGKGAARCATIWEITSVKETNAKNQPFYNVKATDIGFVKDKEVFDRAMKLYAEVKDKELGVAPAEEDDVPTSDRF